MSDTFSMPIKKTSILLSSFLSVTLYGENLVSLNLEDLTQIALSSTTATLSKTSLRDTPASVEVITHKQIIQSGARDLDELLEIYVPSFTYMYKIQGNQIGLRGIISDRNNKILLLVNGHNMNIKAADGGAVTEQWFSMLGDIKKVTVISGSGSSIYGPGAISGIISIETFNGESFEGVEVNGAIGGIQNYTKAEISIAKSISNDISYYLYYGFDIASGASQQDAPEKFSFHYDFADKYTPSIENNKPIGFETTTNNGAFNVKPRHKFHAQLNGKNFSVWLRYTRSSEELTTNQNTIIKYADFGRSDWLEDTGTQNQQLTLAGTYKQKLTQQTTLQYNLAYMRSDVAILYSRNPNETRNKSWGEDNYNAKILFTYDDNKDTTLTLGGEYDYNSFGRSSTFHPSEPSLIASLTNTPGITWHSDMYSFLGEYKTKVSKKNLIFFNMRADKHTYTEWMFSPRFSFIHHFNYNNTLKFLLSRSVRHSDDADLYSQYLKEHSYGDTEKFTSYELIYDHTQANFSFHFSSYYNVHDIVAFDDTNFQTQNIGKTHAAGFEAQMEYALNTQFFFSISHSYNKLLHFTLYNLDIQRQNISASPYGYGDDFANWNNHITKLRCNYKVNSKLKWTNSMQIFWKIPGAQDMSEYNEALSQSYSDTDSLKYKLPVLTSDNAVSQHIYFNSGVTYKANKSLEMQLNTYNLLGFINSDYNIRNYFQRTSHYREMAPSFSCSIHYKF